MIAYHCDKDDCDTWTTNLDHFILVLHPGIKRSFHYCCNWCMVVEESKTAEPTMEVK
jgi:hypothetical protein